jgi:enamine deaminase RidA (YjgF/YER057c/UK114 family)
MRVFRLVAIACGLAIVALPAQKKNKEEETQTLQLPKELPNEIEGETRRLTFSVTPLSSKGLLSQQVRNALKFLAHNSHGGTVLKIRAFVSGTGDLRRVRDLVSEVFTDRKQPLPVLSAIRVGALPLEGAQVVLEGIVAAKKEANPGGLAFISAYPATSANPLDPVAPLTAKTLASLHQAIRAAGVEAADVLRVTCFLSSLDNFAATRGLVEAEYPRAALNYVQTQRAPMTAVSACEAVARLGGNGGPPLAFLDPPGLPHEPGISGVALVSAPGVVLTGTQISFGYQDRDARLAFERLGKSLEQAGASPKNVAFAHYYPLSGGLAAQVKKIGGEFFNGDHPPAGTALTFEGLPSMDAGFALDVVAVKRTEPRP